MNGKKLHVKLLIVNYLAGLLEADSENIYKAEIIEMIKSIHEL